MPSVVEIATLISKIATAVLLGHTSDIMGGCGAGEGSWRHKDFYFPFAASRHKVSLKQLLLTTGPYFFRWFPVNVCDLGLCRLF